MLINLLRSSAFPKKILPHKEIMDSKHDITKFWSIIKTLAPSKHVSLVPVVLKDEKTGNKINRPDLIAE